MQVMPHVTAPRLFAISVLALLSWIAYELNEIDGMLAEVAQSVRRTGNDTVDAIQVLQDHVDDAAKRIALAAASR